MSFQKNLILSLLWLTPCFIFAQSKTKTPKKAATTTQSSTNDPEAANNALYNEAVAAYNARDLKTAEKLFDKVLKADPKNWRAYVNRGQIFLIQKQTAKGLADFQAAKEIKPDDATLRYDIGVIEAGCKQQDDAISSFGQAIALNKNYAKAYSNRAELYRMKKNYAAAKTDLTKAKALDKNMILPYFTQAQMLIDEKKYKEAVAQLDTVCLTFPAEMQPYMQRGIALSELKRYKEAGLDFSKVIFLDKKYAAAYIERGKTRIALKMDDDACEDFARAADLNHPNAGEYMRDYCNN
jgi:tetratricopeptide (TPR) repeat protein